MTLTWKKVFNTNLHIWGSIPFARNAAKSVWYQYFVWNGRVYNVDDTVLSPDTAVCMEEEVQ